MALYFDGITDSVDFGNYSQFDLTTSYSISCWFKTSALATGYLIGKMNTNVSSSGYELFCGGGALNFTIGTDIDVYQITGYYTDNIWHNVVVTVNINTKTMTMYVDGLQVISSGYLGNLTNYVGSLTVGNDDLQSQGFNGYVDDARIYRRALSVNEILTIYNCRGNDGIVNGLVLKCLMDEKHSAAVASGTGVIKDLTGTSNGTPTGSPVYAESILTTRRML